MKTKAEMNKNWYNKRSEKQKETSLENNRRYKLTRSGVVGTIYQSQRASSKRRGHPMPEYTVEELRTAVLKMPLFDTLYNDWVASGYEKDLKPSLDRNDDDLPYLKSNITLMTWGENNAKGAADRKSGRSTGGEGIHRNMSVIQCTLDGDDIATYHSTMEASRQSGVGQSNISDCCRGKKMDSSRKLGYVNVRTAGGFKWRYA